MSTAKHRPNRPTFRITCLYPMLTLLLFAHASGLLGHAQGSAAPQSAASQSAASHSEPARRQMTDRMLALPLHFEPAPDNTLKSRAGKLNVQVGRGGEVSLSSSGRASVNMTLAGASASLPRGEDPLPGKSNYFLGGDSSQWRRGVDQFSKARVDGVYPGIDVLYYGNGKQLEHDYLVAPNADPAQIQMRFHGGTASLDPVNGDIVVQSLDSASEMLRLHKPVAYQSKLDGSRMPVEASYLRDAKGEIGFSMGAYDHTLPLVIDPVILYSTYFGGAGQDIVQDLKVDSAGNIYFLMETSSQMLPQKGNPPGLCNGSCDTNKQAYSFDNDFYVAKLDASGQHLEFATYIGGSSDDNPSSLAIDASGNVYISGQSSSSDFPVKNAYQTSLSGMNSLSSTLTKLSADGSQLLYSSFIGFGDPQINGSHVSTPNTLALGPDGIAYIQGFAGYTGGDYINPVNPFFKEGKDFVAKFDTTKSGAASLLFASPIGDDANPKGIVYLYSIATDSKGDLWIFGQTFSFTFPKPTSGALQTSCGTLSYCENGFLLEIDAAGTAVSYASFFGGTTEPQNTSGLTPLSISIDGSDSIYLLGRTSQTDFPLKNQVYGYEIASDPDEDRGFMTRVAAGGQQIIYSTLLPLALGGTPGNVVSLGSVTGTSTGLAAVALFAESGEQTKNSLPTPTLTEGHGDGFFYLFDTTQSGDDSLLIASYLGSSDGATFPFQIQFDPAYNLVIGGETSATDLPVVNPYQPTCASPCGVYDGFLMRIQPLNSFTVLPSSLTFPTTADGSTSAAMTATFINATTNTIHTTAPVLSDTKDFTASGDCSTIAAGSDCTVTFTFTPQGSGTLKATYSLANESDSNNPLVVQLSGTGVAAAAPKLPTVSPSTLDFGNVTVGTTSPAKVLTVSNPNTTPVTLASLSALGYYSIQGSGTTCSTSAAIPGGGSCTVAIVFQPGLSGNDPGLFMAYVPTDATGQTDAVINAALTGTGVAVPSAALTPTSLNFGNMTVGGTPVFNSLNYANTSSVTIHISQPVFSNPAYSTPATCPTTLAPQQGCAFEVAFNAPSAGTFSGTVSITSPEAGKQTSTVTGAGVAANPPDFTIDNPSGGTIVVHRGFSSNLVIDVSSAKASAPFTSPVTFSTSGLPAGVTATFAPSTLTPGTGGSSTTLTVTAALLAAQNKPMAPLSPGGRAAAFGISAAALMFGLFGSRKKLNARLLLCLCALGLIGGMIGCGGFTGSTIPPSTSTVVVTATSGSISHTISLTLTVE